MVEYESHIGTAGIEKKQNEDIRIGQFKIADILPTYAAEPEGLDLAHATVTLVSQQHSTSTEYLAIIHDSLQKERLYSFLNHTMNDVHDPGIIDVSVDWEMPDRALRRNYDSDQQLQRMHEHLGESWHVFGQYRHIFMEAMSLRGFRNLAPAFLLDNFFMFEKPSDHTANVFQNNKQFHKALFFAATKDMSKSELQETLRNTYLNDLTQNELKMTSIKLKKRLFKHITNSSTYAQNFLTTEAGKHFLSEYSESLPKYEFPITKDENVFIYVVKNGGVVKPAPKIFTKNFFGYDVPYELVCENGTVFYKRIYRDEIIPIIHWTKNETRRTVHTNEIQNEPLFIETAWTSEEINKTKWQGNSLLGLLTIAYFSPEVRSDWPSIMGLPTSRRQQIIGPAQAPILAHMRKHELEKNSLFLQKIEAAGKDL